MKHVWSEQPVGEEIGPIGAPLAQREGPQLLIGAYAPPAMRRVGRWAEGFTSGGVPDSGQVRQMFDLVEESRRAEGREGKRRLVLLLCSRPRRRARRRLPARLLQLVRACGRRHGEIHPLLP